MIQNVYNLLLNLASIRGVDSALFALLEIAQKSRTRDIMALVLRMD